VQVLASEKAARKKLGVKKCNPQRVTAGANDERVHAIALGHIYGANKVEGRHACKARRITNIVNRWP